jgi:hypothetical protein
MKTISSDLEILATEAGVARQSSRAGFRFVLVRALCLLLMALAGGLLPGTALASQHQIVDSNTMFAPQVGSPVHLPNFLDPNAGCAWSGVAGQVFDPQGVPITGLIINIEGVVDGSPVSYHDLSGSSLRLGAGGYEVKLAGQALTSQGLFVLQLTDVTGAELSSPFNLVTSAACDKNLLIFNLAEIVVVKRLYLPMIKR